VYRRMGYWKESQSLISRVIRYNPQEALFLTNIGLSFTYLHDYDSALIFHQKAIDMMPGWPAGYGNKIETLILKSGKTAEARTLVETAIKKTGDNMIGRRILLDIYDRKYEDALQLAEKSGDGHFEDNGNRYLYLATISTLLKNQKNARLYYDSARVSLTTALSKDPINCEIHGLTGIAYAGLGNKIKAIEEGEKSIALTQKNKVDESDMRITFAKILTMVGEYDKAIAEIAFLLNNQSRLSVGLLELDPVWKPLMDNPEYKAMIMKYSKN
jgi:tetratricopeptide (TPR) repeat protein